MGFIADLSVATVRPPSATDTEPMSVAEIVAEIDALEQHCNELPGDIPDNLDNRTNELYARLVVTPSTNLREVAAKLRLGLLVPVELGGSGGVERSLDHWKYQDLPQLCYEDATVISAAIDLRQMSHAEG